MTLHRLKPLLLAVSLPLAGGFSLTAQDSKPVVPESKPAPAAKTPTKASGKSSQPTGKDAGEKGKTSARKAKKKALPPPNYNLNEQAPANPVSRPPSPKFRSKAKEEKLPYSKRLNLNAATKEELMKLPGIKEELATKIIAARPFTSTTGLVLNKVIPTTVYFLIKGKVAAGPVPSK